MSYDPMKAGALCEQCPLRGSTVVPPEGPAEPEMVIVGEGPGFMEVKKRKPFIGPSGMLLNELLERSGLSRSKVLVTNAVLCRAEVPDDNVRPAKKFDIPTYLAWLRKENARRKKAAKDAGSSEHPQLLSDPFLCCSQRLWNELHYVDHVARTRGRPNGAVVLALGNKALEMTTGKVGVMKWRGSPLNPVGQQSPLEVFMEQYRKDHVYQRPLIPIKHDDGTNRTVMTVPTHSSATGNLVGPRGNSSAEDRFFALVRVEHECWIWTGANQRSSAKKGAAAAKHGGYPVFTEDGRAIRTVWWSYKNWVDPSVPRGTSMTQTCGNRSCVQPRHIVIKKKQNGSLQLSGS